ncbi:hypothetical protein FKG94_10785 [Exilibacterium tricleocarpae]|uniref:Uncharacterized protein n=1 Tax=Exilibacterium tricleocarpae TaxID=2591008 RepID=A0A545TSE8_9GAMM|nr:hypothetical protein [Exilibacterium tricleocarpae]TQV80145.1 hypothetical protein FKG94_10785 [Exilibacterium tricleocarpae]
MGIGSWTPDTASSDNTISVDRARLQQFIDLSRRDAWDQLQQLFPGDSLQQQSRLMRLGKQRWFAIADDFDSDAIVHLVRFFTVAEMQLPGWEAGAESPVVWLVKVLRRRKNPPARELLVWIKANSTNKFLPNGALV